jgi:hypothetical protein
MDTIGTKDVRAAALALFTEAYEGSAAAGGCWFTDGEPGTDVLGTLGALSAAEAVRPLGTGLSAAAHASHLRFALDLALRAMRGENPYAGADWHSSWIVDLKDDASWKALLGDIRRLYGEIRKILESSDGWLSGPALTGCLSLAAHAAWHLGAIRQGLGLIKF